jgi:hypothetical protein
MGPSNPTNHSPNIFSYNPVFSPKSRYSLLSSPKASSKSPLGKLGEKIKDFLPPKRKAIPNRSPKVEFSSKISPQEALNALADLNQSIQKTPELADMYMPPKHLKEFIQDALQVIRNAMKAGIDSYFTPDGKERKILSLLASIETCSLGFGKFARKNPPLWTQVNNLKKENNIEKVENKFSNLVNLFKQIEIEGIQPQSPLSLSSFLSVLDDCKEAGIHLLNEKNPESISLLSIITKLEKLPSIKETLTRNPELANKLKDLKEYETLWHALNRVDVLQSFGKSEDNGVTLLEILYLIEDNAINKCALEQNLNLTQFLFLMKKKEVEKLTSYFD